MAKKQFKAESKRLLDLMINSIYTHKEIFLREIISNASDAIDKLCYIALTDDQVGLNRSDFKIEINVDKEAKTITVSDNGIGMDKEELENNLGVIASSGSYKFRQETADKDSSDIDIIGQFGVGFYSAFMIAQDITVITKKYGAEQAYQWQSSGADGYVISECEKDSVGTDIIMHIKDDTEDEKYSEYLDNYKLYSLVKKYSDYIRYPIRLVTPVQKVKEGSSEDKPEYEMVEEMTTINSMVPLWQRKRSEVSDEEYQKFYSELARDFEKPQRVITVSAEGSVTYKALLFVPGKKPLNFNTEDFEKGLQLYSAGVMIMDKCDALLPDYLRFVRGVVDSPDLSLNISRELLQQSRVELFYCGSASEERVTDALLSAFAALPRGTAEIWQPMQKLSAPAQPRIITEAMEVTQGKLAMGLRCATDDVPAMILANLMFGGWSNSKLFLNVREKLSLCYYASSSYARSKGILTVSSGIETKDYDRAVEEILRQLRAIQSGDWEEWELEGARSTMLSALTSLGDSQGALENYYLGQAATEQHESPEEMAAMIREVTPERIRAAAETVALDTIYFLRGKEAEA